MGNTESGARGPVDRAAAGEAQEAAPVKAPRLGRSVLTRFRSRLARRLRWAWHPLLYAGILLGFLTGRAVAVSHVAPFGIAFLAAVRGAGFSPFRALPVLLSVAAGALTVLPLVEAGWVALALLVLYGASSPLRVEPENPKPLPMALLAAAVTPLPLYMLRPQPEVLQVVFWSTLVGLLAVVFTAGVADVTGGRLLRAGPSDLPVPAIVLLAAALTGLNGLILWERLSLHGAAAGLAVMSSAYAGGLALGASAGAVIGISFFFDAIGAPLPTGPGAGLPTPEAQALAYVIAGFLAGAFRDLRKPGVGLAYALAFITYTMATQGLGSILESMLVTTGVAVACFWLMPRAWIKWVPSGLLIRKPETGEAEQRMEEPLSEATDNLRSMSRVLKEVQRTLEQAASAETAVDASPSGALEQLTDRVCRSCSMYAQCWRRDLDKTFHLFADLWAELERQGTAAITPPPAQLEDNCIYPDQVASTLSYLHDIERSRRAFSRRLEEERSIAGEYVKNVARLLDRMADEVERSGGRLRPTEPPILKITAAVSRLPRRGGHISGDSYEATPLSGGRYLLALSDGMGVGQQAAAQSKQCVRLLRHLLDAGFSTEVAVKTVNSVLLLKAPEESFATVDLTLCDLTTGKAEFVKVGAAPSFLKRGSDVTLIKQPSVPVGIINKVEVEPEYRSLQPGDLVIMISDGIWDAASGHRDREGWIFDYLSHEASDDPEQIAERLLARALQYDSAPDDDLTVLVAKAWAADGTRSEPVKTPHRSGEWAPAALSPRSKARVKAAAKGAPR